MHDQPDDVVRVQDIQGPQGLGNLFIVPLLSINHVQLNGEVPVFISDYGIREFPGNVLAVIFYVVHPFDVTLKGITGMADEFNVALLEQWIVHCQTSQFGRANGGEIRRVRKQNHPAETLHIDVDNSFLKKSD